MIEAKILNLIQSLNQGAAQDVELQSGQVKVLQSYQKSIEELSFQKRDDLSQTSDFESQQNHKQKLQMFDRIIKSIEVKINGLIQNAKTNGNDQSWRDQMLNGILSDIQNSKTQIIQHQNTRHQLKAGELNETQLVENGLKSSESAEQDGQTKQKAYLNKLERVTTRVSQNLQQSIREFKDMKFNLKLTQYGTLAFGTALKVMAQALGPASVVVDSAVEAGKVFASNKVSEHSQNKIQNWQRENQMQKKSIEVSHSAVQLQQKDVQKTQQNKIERLKFLDS